jgi:predicted N-acetyltransferase YhbS
VIIDSPNASHIPALRTLWKQAFGDEDAFLDKFFTHGFSENRCRCIFEKGQPVSVLYWFDCTWEDQKLAYLYAVATDQAYQGQGLCRRLMDDTHNHLHTLGYHGTVLVPGSESLFGFYGKMGYSPCSPVHRFSCDAAMAVAVQKISPTEYARLRKNYLPEGSILQEGEFLTFLESFACFYQGENCLFCGSADNGVFHAQEYLGDPQAAPGCLAALGLKKGHFRTPGAGASLAMFYPLSPSEKLPAYLGIPLD